MEARMCIRYIQYTIPYIYKVLYVYYPIQYLETPAVGLGGSVAAKLQLLSQQQPDLSPSPQYGGFTIGAHHSR